jgi:thiol-disulfide isomerase/thioredoxin
MPLLRCLLLGLGLFGAVATATSDTRPLPEFTSSAAEHWFNSEPLSVAGLRGKVLLVDVWTFGCWNCYRSFPWLKGLEERLRGEPFQVIGIHSPEFEHERDPGRVAAKIAEFGLQHPVMLDNDFGYWRALGNRYWPAFYLVDRQGRIRHLHVGETHAGDARARRIEQQLRALLGE